LTMPRFLAFSVFVASLSVASPATAQLVTSTWNGSTGNWLDPSLWSPAVPNNGTPAGATYNVVANGSGAISLNQPVAIQQLSFPSGTIAVENQGSLTVQAGGSGAGNFQVAGGSTLHFTNAAYTAQQGSSFTGDGTFQFTGPDPLPGLFQQNVSGFSNNGHTILHRTRLAFGSPAQTNTLTMEDASVRYGSMTVTGSAMANSSGITSTSLTVNGGMTITNGFGLGFMTAGGGSSLTLAGGVSTWSSGNLFIDSGCAVQVANGATFEISSNGTVTWGFGSYGGAIVNHGMLRKRDSSSTLGVRSLTGSGPIEVLAGALIGNPGGAISPIGVVSSGQIFIASGASLGGKVSSGGSIRGSGTLGVVGIGSDIRISGLLSPGDGVGTMTAIAPFSLTNSARMEFELNGTTPGTLHDQLFLATTGIVVLGNSTLVPVLGFEPALGPGGDALTILTGSGTITQVVGQFSNGGNGQIISLGLFDGVHYGARIRYLPRSVVLDNFQVLPIPEPTSLALCGLAAIAGFRVLRRRFTPLASLAAVCPAPDRDR
jgi:hypothetical protein